MKFINIRDDKFSSKEILTILKKNNPNYTSGDLNKLIFELFCNNFKDNNETNKKLFHKEFKNIWKFKDYKKSSFKDYLIRELSKYKIGTIIDTLAVLENSNEVELKGIYFTPYNIADEIVKLSFGQVNNKKFYDPCCGTGIFLSRYIKFYFDKFKNVKNLKYECSDINENFVKYADILNQIETGTTNLSKIKNRNNFYKSDFLMSPIYKSLLDKNTELFPNKNAEIGFIATNPPYNRLKGDRVSKKEKEEINNYKKNIFLNNNFELISSTPDLYKMFLEKILKISNQNTVIGLIIPKTLLNDLSTYKIRKYLIDNGILKIIKTYRENENLFKDVKQAFMILILFNDNHKSVKFNNSKLDYNFLKSINYEIIDINKNELKYFHTLDNYKKIKDLKNFEVQRGEIDITIDREVYSNGGETRYFTGKCIGEYKTRKSELASIKVFNKLKSTSLKFKDISSERIVCHQISNMDTYKRLKFCKIPKNSLIANSLNYIKIKKYNVDLILCLLNSYLINWYFKLFSSNNHINNYELNNIPIPDISKTDQDAIITIYKNYIKNFDFNLRVKLERKINKVYGIDENFLINEIKNT